MSDHERDNDRATSKLVGDSSIKSLPPLAEIAVRSQIQNVLRKPTTTPRPGSGNTSFRNER